MNSGVAVKDTDVKISIRDVKKVFYIKDKKGKVVDEFTALDGIDLDIKRGEFITIVGPSGCGKSTLLDILAGLSRPMSGQVLIDQKALTGPGQNSGIVMQGYGLFPWRTVKKNIEYGLEIKGIPKEKRGEISDRFISMVGLEKFKNRFPFELSGGMKQRVAIARVLAYDPDILLMDEPFGALDEQTREILQDELVTIWQQTKKTIVFITHSIEEAVYLGDRVVVMGSNPGHVRDIFDIDLPRPRNKVRLTEEFIRVSSKVSLSLHGGKSI
ncbi:MAG: ABC transporter ATP-binding protein [Lachnospiraceae bacterium]|nr:ABC transporter ATP-binding protein [Lachnospiraceae bacterium]